MNPIDALIPAALAVVRARLALDAGHPDECRTRLVVALNGLTDDTGEIPADVAGALVFALADVAAGMATMACGTTARADAFLADRAAGSGALVMA